MLGREQQASRDAGKFIVAKIAAKSVMETSNLSQWLKQLSEAELRSSPRSNQTVFRDGRAYRYVKTLKSDFRNGTSMSKLHIEKVALLDDGTYICVAATNQGYNYKEIHLTVLPGKRTLGLFSFST